MGREFQSLFHVTQFMQSFMLPGDVRLSGDPPEWTDEQVGDTRKKILENIVANADQYHLFLQGTLEAPVQVIGGVS